jgi:D-alanyl-D-alanine carboxypeptidase/D-alanyl-D-alanine-endopeptidase (penicillin-binding protein 4)
MPASNQKLWTAAGVHLTLPADFTFRTSLFTTGSRQAGVLTGDLYVVGGGDPTLTTTGAHSLDALAAEIKRHGIDRITGRIVIDETRFDTVRTPGGWEPWQLEFVGPLSAFMVDWNNIRKEPEFMNDPTRQNALRFVERLSKAGVEVGGGVAVAPISPDATLLFSVDSWPLPKLMTHMLSESDNMMAESFVREIGRRVNGVGSTVAGLAAIDSVITKALCLPKEGLNDDGSGVSHYSVHSARYWRHLLEVIRAQPWGAQFESELAVSGKMGTMATRLKSPAMTGRVHAKTGTVRGGRALSGYATTVGGRDVVFSIIGNGDDKSLTTKVIDELVETIVAFDG